MNYNLGLEDWLGVKEKEDRYLSELRSIKALPQDREGLIWAYALRFIPMAIEEYTEYTEIETEENVERLIRKYGIREQAQRAKGDKERELSLLHSLLRNKDLQEESFNFLMDFVEVKAKEFVTSKRNRLRAKALLLMGEEQLNGKELAYLRGEGEFWYNETEEE